LGEIKSTIDLVLEKTRNLTLSKEEKLSLAQEELEKKIGVLLNRYLDSKACVKDTRNGLNK